MCISRKPQQFKLRTTVVAQVDMKIAAISVRVFFRAFLTRFKTAPRSLVSQAGPSHCDVCSCRRDLTLVISLKYICNRPLFDPVFNGFLRDGFVEVFGFGAQLHRLSFVKAHVPTLNVEEYK
jgi:hypothetical protein